MYAIKVTAGHRLIKLLFRHLSAKKISNSIKIYKELLTFCTKVMIFQITLYWNALTEVKKRDYYLDKMVSLKKTLL